MTTHESMHLVRGTALPGRTRISVSSGGRIHKVTTGEDRLGLSRKTMFMDTQCGRSELSLRVRGHSRVRGSHCMCDLRQVSPLWASVPHLYNEQAKPEASCQVLTLYCPCLTFISGKEGPDSQCAIEIQPLVKC